ARLKDEFLASMSHELRTPLTGILGLAESLQFQTYGELNERQIKCLSIMESSGRHLLDLINDILDLSKIEAGKMSVDLEACRVSDICRSSLQLIKGMATKKRQLVTYAIQRESIVLLADARRLKQMLVNLLSNAVKFTQDAGSLGLEVCLNEADQVVEFAVWDKGIGIAPENLDRLFTPFTQIDSQISRQFSGTGLGLSLVKRMAELHGGSLKVESTAGEGSRFTLVMPWSADIVLPAVEPAPQEARASGPQRLQDANGAPAYKPLILVCDDNQEILDLVADYLLINGFRIVSVQNGAELLQRTVELQPDLLVTDIQLPGVEGLDILRQLRAHPQPAVAGLPVLALTALAMAGDRERVLKAGADDYLSKPLVLKQLVDRIGALLKARSGA
ncbi:MAG: ATP-binding protein, partial [Chloroflexota bacterium]